MNQEQFSESIQQAYKEALAGADAITANARLILSEAEKERDTAQEIRRTAEAKGDSLAVDYFQKARAAVVEAAVTERLRNLTRAHLEAGKSVEEICAWLEVDEDFVEKIREVLQRVTVVQASGLKPDGAPTLRYQNYGRGGTIWYENGTVSFDMWWEFATGEALVIVDIPPPSQWEKKTRLPLEARDEVLSFIGHSLIAERNAGKGSFLIGENVLTIYNR